MLDGLVYEDLSDPLPAVRRLGWLARSREFRPRPFRQLAEFYRSSGRDEDARLVVLLTAQRMRRRTPGPAGRVYGVLLDLTVGYGYRPWLAGAWLLGLLAAGPARAGERLEPNRRRLTRYTLVVQDYGGPVGFRLAIAHPERLAALIVENAVAHEDGLGPLWKTRREFWADRQTHEAALRESFFSFAPTRQRHVGTSPDVENYDLIADLIRRFLRVHVR